MTKRRSLTRMFARPLREIRAAVTARAQQRYRRGFVRATLTLAPDGLVALQLQALEVVSQSR